METIKQKGETRPDYELEQLDERKATKHLTLNYIENFEYFGSSGLKSNESDEIRRP